MDYLSVFIEMLEVRNPAPNTIRNYRTYIKPYLSFLHQRGLYSRLVTWDVGRKFYVSSPGFPPSRRPGDKHSDFPSSVFLDLYPLSALRYFPDSFPEVPHLPALRLR